MSSIIRRFMDTFYPRRVATPVTVLGLDYSGKTTLVYRIKSGDVVQTIPTIGLSAETIDLSTTNGKLLRISAWDVGTRCGIGYAHPLFRHYISDTKALLWVVDASDSERLLESVEALGELLSGFEGNDQTEDVKQELPILILANKSDQPDAMSLDYLRVAFSKKTSGKMTSMFKTSLIKDNKLSRTGVPEALDWLELAIETLVSGDESSPTKNSHEKLTPNTSASMNLANKLESWLKRVETDSSPELFLEQFNSFTLPEWDHYTHIRIAYVILTKYGRREGKDIIFKGLEKYISVSPQTKKKSFHVTMTYFWIQIVHFGIRSMTPKMTPEPYNIPFSSPIGSRATPDDFSRFLFTNPHVADGNLWSEYYTKDVMMSPKARAEMVLPDKKPLPNLVILDAVHTPRRRSM